MPAAVRELIVDLGIDWAFYLIVAVEQRSQWCNMNVGGHAMSYRKAAGRNAVDAQDGPEIQDMEEAGTAISQPADPTTPSVSMETQSLHSKEHFDKRKTTNKLKKKKKSRT